MEQTHHQLFQELIPLMLYVNTWFLLSHVTGHIISVGAEVVDFLYGFVRDSTVKKCCQAMLRNGCWFI